MKPTEIQALLPEIYRRSVQPRAPLAAILQVMAALHQPDETILEELPDYFAPYSSPEDFLPFLARWVDLDRYLGQEAAPHFPPGLGRLRELMAAAAELSRWRGSARGLTRFLELATGIPGFRVEENPPDDEGRPRPFHIRIHAPQQARPYHTLLQQIIQQEKPVYVTWELVYAKETAP
jgi:phage tail-like protein